MCENQQNVYIECIKKQLEELDMLSSIYCSPGELKILDPGVVSDLNEFIKDVKNPTSSNLLNGCLDYTIAISVLNGAQEDKLDIRLQLPHLYPMMENAIVIIHSPLLNKSKEVYFKTEIENYIDTMEKDQGYIFQVITWIQDHIEDIIIQKTVEVEPKVNSEDDEVDFERLWIYSHHIKAKTKRQEIVRQSRALELSGFCRPGKPGIICVEGLRENTQNFWGTIRSMNWQKLFICKAETSREKRGKINKKRRFEGFKEQLFSDDVEIGEGLMNMSLFLKYLEQHRSGYMKKELFGFD